MTAPAAAEPDAAEGWDDWAVSDREWRAIRLRQIVPRIVRRRHTRTYVRTRWWR